MDRNYIVELIKDNRLQEALKAIEKATEGSHLHNQVILLSSSYAEYAQMNRAATQDFQTLEMQRAKITNSLLSFLDELSPDAFEKVSNTQTRKTYVEPVQESKTIDKKWYYIGGGVLLLLLIILLLPKGDNQTAAYTDETTAQTNEMNGFTVKSVVYDANGHFTKDGESWIEETKEGESLRLHEEKTETCCVHLRDDMRNMNVLLDLTLGRITWQGDDGSKYFVNIQEAH
jgi:Effector-associated domain 11